MNDDRRDTDKMHPSKHSDVSNMIVRWVDQSMVSARKISATRCAITWQRNGEHRQATPKGSKSTCSSQAGVWPRFIHRSHVQHLRKCGSRGRVPHLSRPRSLDKHSTHGRRWWRYPITPPRDGSHVGSARMARVGELERAVIVERRRPLSTRGKATTTSECRVCSDQSI